MTDTPPNRIKAATPPPEEKSKAKTKAKEPPKDKPPKKTPPKVERPKRSAPGKPPELERRLQEFFVNIALVVSAVVDVTDGQIIASNSEQMARSWAQLAKENPKVNKAINRMLEGGAWSGVIMSTGTVAFAIAQNHGALPAFTFGLATDQPPTDAE